MGFKTVFSTLKTNKQISGPFSCIMQDVNCIAFITNHLEQGLVTTLHAKLHDEAKLIQFLAPLLVPLGYQCIPDLISLGDMRHAWETSPPAHIISLVKHVYTVSSKLGLHVLLVRLRVICNKLPGFEVVWFEVV